MSFAAPASIPQITFAPYSYASSPRYPAVGTVHCDRAYNDEHVSLKVHLRSILKKSKLSYMPVGFPFHCNPGSRPEDDRISYSSYEFPEYLYLDPRERPQCAVFSYTAPTFGSYSKTASRMMTWRINVPAREPTLPRHTPKQVSIAHVEVDPLVMETPFGLDFMTNPRILLAALAISIELGILINIQIANSRTPYLYASKKNVYYESGEIVFVAVDNHGRSEVVFVFES